MQLHFVYFLLQLTYITPHEINCLLSRYLILMAVVVLKFNWHFKKYAFVCKLTIRFIACLLELANRSLTYGRLMRRN